MEAVLIDDDPPFNPQASLRMDHRFGRRFECGTPVRLTAASGLAGQGRMRDVSLSGAFVETALDLPLFTQVSLFRTTPANRVIEMRGSVVRRDHTGFGVEWCETPPGSICEVFGCPHPCREI
jgi:hypothetical protein